MTASFRAAVRVVSSLVEIREHLESACDCIDLAPLNNEAEFRMQIEDARTLVANANEALKELDASEAFREKNGELAGMA